MSKIKVVCENCGKIIKREPKDIKRRKHHFCNRKCDGEWRRKNRVECVCLFCSNIFPLTVGQIKQGRGKFCTRKCYAQWQKSDKEYLNYLSRIGKIKRINKKQNKPELIFQKICEKNNLDFHYVGDGQLWIGKKRKLNPDFIEANGNKICIEIMGQYWHSPLLNSNLQENNLLTYREKHYRKYKWIPVFIWDTDLLRKDREQFVLKKLKREKII